MMHGYFPGTEQPGELTIPEGQRISGSAIGILILKVGYPLVPGSMFNASTFDFPVLFHILENSDAAKVLAADPTQEALLIEGGRALQRQGVRAIVGSCGYFANYQLNVAAALDEPTFLSSLLQVPLLLRSMKPRQKLGVLCASAPSLRQHTLRQCGVDDASRLVIYGAEELPEFQNILRKTGRLNSARLQDQLVERAIRLVQENADVGALLLECADMPPYAWAIHNATRLPVFDWTTMVNWVHNAVVRRPFAGFM